MSKYRLTQRNIDLVEGFQIQVIDFNTVEELESIDFIKQWMLHPDFIRLSLYQGALIVELNINNITIAFIRNLEGIPTDLSGLNLPIWKTPPPTAPVH